MLIFGGKRQERKIADQLKKNKDIREDEECEKDRRKKETKNTCISS